MLRGTEFKHNSTADEKKLYPVVSQGIHSTSLGSAFFDDGRLIINLNNEAWRQFTNPEMLKLESLTVGFSAATRREPQVGLNEEDFRLLPWADPELERLLDEEETIARRTVSSDDTYRSDMNMLDAQEKRSVSVENVTNITSDKLVTHDEEVRIVAIELTMAFFQETTVTSNTFFTKAKQIEKFILGEEVTNG